MGAQKERDFILKRYPSPGWRARVREMPDDQVIAIYLRMQGEPPPKPIEPQNPKESDEGPEQHPLF